MQSFLLILLVCCTMRGYCSSRPPDSNFEDIDLDTEYSPDTLKKDQPSNLLTNPNVRINRSQSPVMRSSKSVDYIRFNTGCIPIDGTFYSGNHSTTEFGRTCMRWNETRYWGIGDWMKEGQNFCRNPNYGRAFCDVLSSSSGRSNREYCNIPSCLTKELAEEVGCQARGAIYTGKANYTQTGRVCQKWTAQHPHYSGFPEVGDHNYCRNPNGHSKGIWCYTTDPQMGWESCFVPECKTTSVHEKDCVPTDNTVYLGTKNTTKSGRECQMWSVDTPHPRSQYIYDLIYYNPANFTLNYCRNPQGSPFGPWCYTKDPMLLAERCDVPFCGTYTKGKILLFHKIT